MILIKKQVYEQDIIDNSDVLDNVLDDVTENPNTVYLIYRELVPSGVKCMAVILHPKLDLSQVEEEVYQTTVLNDNIIEFPHELINKLEWKEGDELDLSITNLDEGYGVVIRKK